MYKCSLGWQERHVVVKYQIPEDINQEIPIS